MVRRLRGALIDVAPLRASPAYRRLWLGDLIASGGSQVAAVAVPYQVYHQTGSSLAVGLLGLTSLVPLLAGSLAAGAIADAFDRRLLLIGSQCGAGLGLGALALLSASGPAPLAALYVLYAALAVFASIESPVRNAAVPALVGEDRLTSAAALNQLVDQTSQIAGPALAGVLIAGLGLTWAYAIGLCSYLLAASAVARVPPLRPAGAAAAPGWRALAEGFAFARAQPVLLSTFAIDLNAMIFGMPRALFPALAATTYGVGPRGLGLMYAAPAAGALAAVVGSGWVRHVQRQGPAVMASVVVWGLAIAAFGFCGRGLFPLALLLLAVAGAADVISAVFRSTIMQQVTPDALRGRMSALHIAVVTSGPRLGDAESGAVAQVTSVQFSVVSGGLACVAGVALLHLLVPVLAGHRAPGVESRPAPSVGNR
ncbi:MAG: MFS transporter [Gaiellales bacterium]